MADIMMCNGTNCKDKKSCYRYTATPEDYQTYMATNENKNFDKKNCRFYWNNKYKGVNGNGQGKFNKDKKFFGRYL